MASKDGDIRSGTHTMHTSSATKGLARTITPFSVMVWNIPKPRTEEEVIAIFELSCGTIVGNGPLKDMRESGDLYFMRLSFSDEHAQTLACALTGTRWEGSKLLIRKFVPRELRSQNPRPRHSSPLSSGAGGNSRGALHSGGSQRSVDTGLGGYGHNVFGTSGDLTGGWAVSQANSIAQRYHPYNYLVGSGYDYSAMAFNPLSVYYGAHTGHQGYAPLTTSATGTTANVTSNQGINPLFAPVITSTGTGTGNEITASAYTNSSNPDNTTQIKNISNDTTNG